MVTSGSRQTPHCARLLFRQIVHAQYNYNNDFENSALELHLPLQPIEII